MKGISALPRIFLTVCFFMLILLMLAEPDISAAGAAEGILISGRIIIPSLFPFTVCVLFLSNSGFFGCLKAVSPLTKRAFGISGEMFSVMILSMIGGYPIGAKLLNDSVENGRITPENAGVMLNYCVNAGPAFIVIAVGNGIYGSKAVGWVLLTAHIVSSFIISLFSSFLMQKGDCSEEKKLHIPSPSDNFVISSASAAKAVFGICGYVIFFSSLNSYLTYYSEKYHILKYISALTEVTNGVYGVKSVLSAAFLLGFAGLSIWCQVLSVGKKIKFKTMLFIGFRIAHGALSAVITKILIKCFKITVPTSTAPVFKPYRGGAALSFSMLSMVIILIISLYYKNNTGKIIDDIV